MFEKFTDRSRKVMQLANQELRFFRLHQEEVERANVIGDFHWCRCTVFGPEQTNVQDAEWLTFVDSCSALSLSRPESKD